MARILSRDRDKDPFNDDEVKKQWKFAAFHKRLPR